MAIKVPDDVLVESYSRLSNVWKVGVETGLSGQAVHERLSKLKVVNRINTLSDDDALLIREVYESGIKRGDGKLKALSEKLERTIPYISRHAGKMGLTSYSNSGTVKHNEEIGKRTKAYIESNGHPKGMLGKKHSDDSLVKISKASIDSWVNKTDEDKAQQTMKMMKTRVQNGTYTNERKGTTWKAAWREIGGVRKYYRSKWEANYAYYLEWLKVNGHIKSWLHEPKTFWFEGVKRGCVSYLPDFYVVENDGSEAYHEVKGWMDARSKTKIKRMAKYHPNTTLIVIDSKAYKELAKKVSAIVPGWER